MNKTKKKSKKSKKSLKTRKVTSKVGLSLLPTFSFNTKKRELKKQHSYLPTFYNKMTQLQNDAKQRFKVRRWSWANQWVWI